MSSNFDYLFRFQRPVDEYLPPHSAGTKSMLPDVFKIILHIDKGFVGIRDEYREYVFEILHNYRHVLHGYHVNYSFGNQTIKDMFFHAFADHKWEQSQYPEVYIQYDDGDQEYEPAKLDSQMTDYYPVGEEPVHPKARRVVYFKLVFNDHRCVRKDFKTELSHVKPAKR